MKSLLIESSVLLAEYRALSMEYRVLFIEYKALLIKYRALLITDRALLTEYRALLLACSGLLMESKLSIDCIFIVQCRAGTCTQLWYVWMGVFTPSVLIGCPLGAVVVSGWVCLYVFMCVA